MFRFIHAADLHIDSPLRGLDRYEGAPVERLRNATRAACERLVDRALAGKVDFILLAGDIYDRDWQDFRTGLFFREQLARLDRAGIRVFIVQGNHDAQGVISRQLLLPANVTVFSSRAAQTVRLDALGVAIHGRSFPDRAVDADLVPTYPAPVPGLVNIGVLHTSLTGRAGHDPYAPTDVATLVGKGYDYWALGHVHAREVVNESPRIVFPGNLQGRHANETGPKGCELVTVDGAQITSEFLALDVVRWHQLTLTLGDIAHDRALHQRFADTVRQCVADAPDRLHALRIHLTGRSPLHSVEARQPGALAAAIQSAAQDFTEAELWIEQVRMALAPSLDRAEVAARDDALGELARLADAIAGDDAALDAWMQKDIAGLLEALPPEAQGDDLPRLADRDAMRALLRDAEATVLARLADAGAES